MASALTLPGHNFTNFAKVVIACRDIIKLPLVDILTANINPSQLSSFLERKSVIDRLTKGEVQQCSVPLPDYKKFDVGLLYKLIRLTCTSLKPKQGWGRKPNDDDITLADDIERIKMFRNEQMAHADSAEISDMQFELIWNDITLVMRRMDSAMQEFKCNTNYEQKMEDVLWRPSTVEEIEPITIGLKEEIENMQKDINIAIAAEKNKRHELRKAPTFERTPEEYELAEASKYIGNDFLILGVILGLKSSEIDQIRLDNPLIRTQIYTMLCFWKNKNPGDATTEKLINAIIKTCSNEDATAVENVLLERTIDENVEKTRTKMASSSSKHRHTISYKVDSAWREIIKKPLRDIWLCQIQYIAPGEGIKPEGRLDVKKLYDLKRLDPFQTSPEAVDKFDVMELYQLIKCFCLIKEPNKGWGQKPEATNTDLGDDIERLIQFKDEVVAFAECPASDVNSSEKIWNDLEFAFERIQTFLKQYGYTSHYQYELIKFKGRISKEENSIIITTECEEFLFSEGRAIVNITMLKMNPNIQHYIAGYKDKDQVIKVFLRSDENEEQKATDDFRRAFFSSNGMRIEFVNVIKRLKELKEGQGQNELEKEIDNSARLQIHEVIERTKWDFFKQYSNITGIRTGRVLSGGKACCIVLYCLDKHIVPFGEKPLPNEIEGWPCDHRYEFGMFAICPFRCPASDKAFPELGCSIGIESELEEPGSFGFLVQSKNNNFHQGFLTAAHVAVQDFERLYENSFLVPGFVPLAIQMTNIMHHSSKSTSVRVGSVVEAFCGNYERRGLDFAFVHSDSFRAFGGNELTVISEDDVSIDDVVRKTGRTTQITEGLIKYKSFNMKVSYSFKEYWFFDCYGIEKIGKGLFSFVGDSGSAVFVKKNGTFKPLGILFGQFGITTAVCKIDRIIDQRNLKIVNI